MDGIQKLHIVRLSNRTHVIFTDVVCTNITTLVQHGLLQIKQYCFIQGVLICENMIIGPISWIDPSNKVGLLHDTFQVGIKFVDTNHDIKDNLSLLSVKKLIICIF